MSKKDDENRQLQEAYQQMQEAYQQMRQEDEARSRVATDNERLQEENERLRELLKEVVDESYWDDEYTLVPHGLFDKIEKEVSDEQEPEST